MRHWHDPMPHHLARQRVDTMDGLRYRILQLAGAFLRIR